MWLVNDVIAIANLNDVIELMMLLLMLSLSLLMCVLICMMHLVLYCCHYNSTTNVVDVCSVVLW